MKTFVKSFLLLSIIAILASCEKDEGKLPNISFKTGGAYLSADATLAGTSVLLIGINASKSEEEDVLKKFNISKSVNGATATTVFDKDLTGAEGDNYSYDYSEILGTTSGETDKYTFTVTNRDGLTNQVSLTVTIQ
jgi:hypothetical protein